MEYHDNCKMDFFPAPEVHLKSNRRESLTPLLKLFHRHAVGKLRSLRAFSLCQQSIDCIGSGAAPMGNNSANNVFELPHLKGFSGFNPA